MYQANNIFVLVLLFMGIRNNQMPAPMHLYVYSSTIVLRVSAHKHYRLHANPCNRAFKRVTHAPSIAIQFSNSDPHRECTLAFGPQTPLPCPALRQNFLRAIKSYVRLLWRWSKICTQLFFFQPSLLVDGWFVRFVGGGSFSVARDEQFNFNNHV